MGEKKIVLVVDDVSLNLRTMQVALSNEFDVRLAKSAEIARQVLSSENIDLILLDIELPGISGLDFLKEIRAVPENKNIPVIIVTSYSSSQIFANAISSGAIDYIVKPFDPSTLLQKVKKTLNML